MKPPVASAPLKVFVVAGELSGDILGGGLLRALKAQHPHIEFKGIGGPRMLAEGMDSLFPLETLSVMGLVEVMRHLPRLFKVRRQLREAALAWGADIMIGIDAPDFTLGLERQLRAHGIRTLHYVSPSVWAWRQGRIKGIKASAEHMLTLLPFEAEFYRQHEMPVTFVGHPLADTLPVEEDQRTARQTLALGSDATVLAMLPGSRRSEVATMLPVFLKTVPLLLADQPQLNIVIPAATPQRHDEITTLLAAEAPDVVAAITVTAEPAATVMTAANAVLLTSGTAALEAMLCHRPMVVAYRMPWLTHAIAKRMVKTRWISLPNLIAQDDMIAELIQDDATPERLHETLRPLLEADNTAIMARFRQLHGQLAQDASAQAASAVLSLVSQTSLD